MSSAPVQANNDLSADSEDCKVTICVLSNDTGASKSLYSVNQGGSAQQTTAVSKFGASIQIVNGNIVYNPAGSAAIQALGAGESITDTFTYTIKSGSTYSTATVTVTVHGTNDAPVLSADVGSHTFTEAAGITGGLAIDSYSGALTFTDINLSDAHTASAKLASTSWSGHGTIPSAASQALAAALSTSVSDSTGTGHGSVSFNFALADKATDFLAAGETLTVTYNVTVSDTHGGTSTKPVVFTITGTNDAPNVTAASVDGDDDDHSSCFSLLNIWGNNSAAAASGEVNFTDPDLNDTHTASASLLTAIASSGTLSASVTADLTSAFKVKIGSDSTGGNTGAANWSYTLPASLKNLPVGQTVLVDYQVNVADGHGGVDTQPVTLLITGASGGATVTAGVASGQVTEMSGATASTVLDKAAGAINLSGGEVNTLSSVASSVAFVSWSGGTGVPSGATAALNSALSLALVADGGCDRYGNAYSSSATWAFASADKNFDFLAQGETLTVVYKVVASDRYGDSVTRLVTLTITGTNDAPVVAADTVASHGTTEIAATTGSAAADTATAALTFTDADLKDTHVASFTAPTVTWSGGATLPAGLSTTLAGALSLSLTDSTNSGAGSVAAKFSATDKSFDFLAKGETLTVTYNVTVTDNNGATSTKPVTFVVTGTNDAPVVAADGVASHAITEVASTTGSTTADTASATLAFTDVDLKDTHTASFAAPTITWSGGATLPAGLAATLVTSLSLSLADSTNTGAGSVTANFSAADKSFDFLAKGETLTFTYNVTVTDNNGAASTQPVKFVVTGTNDTPVVAADSVASHAISEIASNAGAATADTASATLSFTDVDLRDTHTTSFAAPTIAWSAGATLPAGLSATLATSLSLSLTDSTNTGAGSVTAAFSAADKNFDFLAKGETLTVTYNVTVTDNNGATSSQPVKFVITGTNDAPVVAADTAASHAISEIASTTGSTTADTASATLAFTDIDLKDTHTASFAAPAIAWSGGATLPAGLSAALASALSLSVADSTGTGNGSVTAAFSVKDCKFDFLAQGETLTVTYNVTVTDNNGVSSTQPVKFSVTGTNDAPVLAADTGTHAMTEIAGVANSNTLDTASATLTFSDVDLNDSHSVSYSETGAVWSGGSALPPGLSGLATVLSLTLNDSTGTGAGSLTASFAAVDQAFDFLAAGETLTVTYAVTVKDNNGATSTQSVSFVITGTNDAPVVSADTGTHAISETSGITGSATADTASATLSFADADLNDTHTAFFAAPAVSWSGGSTLPSGLATSLASALSLSLTDSTGTGAGSVAASFSAKDCKFDFLAQGETLTVTYNVTVTDNNGATSTKPVTFTVTGTNDAPVLAADAGSHAFSETAGSGPHPGHTVSTTLGFTDVDLTDGHTASVAAPVIAWSGGATLPGNLAATLAGALTTTITDSTGSGAGSVHVAFSAGDSTFDFLAQGETLAVTYNVTVTDNNGATSTQPVTITVTGSNDAPVLAADTVKGGHAITEADGVTGSSTADTASVSLSFGDVDLNDTHTAIAATPTITWSGGAVLPDGLAATLGSALSLSVADSTGTGAGSVAVNFAAADSSFDFLAQGETLNVSYDVTVTDNNGAASTRTVAFTVTGTNDTPTIAAVTVNQAVDATAHASATVGFADVDLSDTHTVGYAAPSFVLSTGGAMPAGLADSLAHALTLSESDSTGTGAGSFTAAFQSDPAALSFLGLGDTLTVTYVVTVTDNNGATATKPVTFTVTGTNSAPVVAADTASHALTEAAGVTGSSAVDSAAATLNFTDSGYDTHTVAATAPTVTWSGGATLPAGLSTAITNGLSLQLNDSHNTGTGSVVATLAAPDSTFDFLAKGETLTVTTTVTVTDNHGASASQPVTFTVTGTNDAPVFGAAFEDPAQSFTLSETAGATGSLTPDTLAIVTHFHDADLNNTHSLAAGTPSISFSGGAVPAGLADTLAHAVSLSLADSTGTGTGAITATFASPDNSFDFLAQGETLTVTYDVTVTDDNGATATKPISFTVIGTNDAPVLAAQAPAATIDFSTVDSITPNYDYVIGDYQFSNATVTSDSGTNNSASLLLGGRGDSVIARGDGGEFSLQGFDIGSRFISTTATVLITAYDHGTAVGTQTVSVNPGDPISHVTLDSSFGQVDQVTMSVSGGGHDVDIYLDNMVLGGAGNSAAMIEAAGVTGSTAVDSQVAALAFGDVDLSDTHVISSGAPTLAWSGGTAPAGLDATLASALSLSLDDSTGTGHGAVHASFAAPDSSFDFLAQGETLTVTYDVTVTDNHGAISTQPVSFTVTGTNDAPVLAPSDTPTVAPAGPTTVTQTIGFEPSDYYNGIYDNQSGLSAAQIDGFIVAGGNINPYNYEGNPNGAGPSGNFEMYSSYYGGGFNGQQGDIHRADGAEFALKSIDISAQYPESQGQGDVQFVGYDHGVQVASLDVTNVVDYSYNAVEYQTVTFGAEWSQVDDVQLYVNGTYLEELDNLVVVAPAAAQGGIGFENSDQITYFNDPITGAGGFTDGGFSFGGMTFNPNSYTGNPYGPGQAGNAWMYTSQTLSNGAQAEIQRTDGAQFALKSVDLGSYYSNYYGNAQVTFVGYDHGQQVASQTFADPNSYVYGIDYQTVTFGAAWSQVDDVRVYVNGNYYEMLDNVVTDTGNSATGGPVGTLTETAGVTGSSVLDSVTGTLTFTDVDLSDTHVASAGAPVIVVSGNTALPDGVADTLAAGLSLAVTDSTGTGAGSIAITQAVADGTYDFLAEGQTLTVTYQIIVTDNNGASSTQPATFVITGTNDAPVIAADTTGIHAVTEAAGVTGSTTIHDAQNATLSFTDADLTDTHTVAGGTPTLVWSGGTAPAGLASTLAGALSLSLADSTNSGTGSITAGFSAVDSNFDFLAKGETLTVTYPVTVTDNNGATSTQNVTFTVTGTNDAPVIAANSGASTSEANGATGSTASDTATAVVHFTDVDLNDTHIASVASAPATVTWSGGATLPSGLVTGLAGAVTLSSVSDSTGTGNGSVTASFSAADKSFDFLAAGETLTVAYNVTVTDNNGGTSTKPVTFTITGTNDAPVLAADTTSSHAITELTATTGAATADTATATLSFTDVDLKDTHTASFAAPTLTWSGGTTPPGGLASALANTLSLTTSDANGTVTANFSAADSKFDFLAKGETLTVTYNVTVADNHGGTSTKPVVFVVTGTNDAPQIVVSSGANEAFNFDSSSGITTGSNTINGNYQPTFTDNDFAFKGFNFYPYGLGNPIGSAYAYGGWAHLADGSSGEIVKSDGSEFSLKSLDVSGYDGGYTGSGSLTITGFDHGAAVATQTISNFAANTYDNTSYQSVLLNSSFGKVDDVRFTISGTDYLFIDNVSVGASTGGAQLNETAGTTGASASDSATAVVNFADADLNDTHTAGVAATPTTVTWSKGGTLPSGLAASLANAVTLSVADSTGTGSGSVSATFAAADKAFDFLATGETLQVVYNMTITDNNGASTSQAVTFTVTGTNDAPVVAADTGSHTTTEAAGVTGSSAADTASATLSFTDVDLSDTHTASGGTPTLVWSGGAAPSGLDSALASALSLSVSDSTGTGMGSVTANFSATDSKFDFLAAGETLAVTYNVTVSDNHGGTSTQPVTFTVTGTNDAPVLNAGSASVNEASNVTGSSSNDTATATLAFSDVDLKDTHTASYAAPTITWSGGATLPSGLATTLASALALTVTDSTGSGNGSVTAKLAAADSSFDFLAQGETLTVAYNVTVTDNNGGISTKPVTFTITGTNDAPVLAADTTSSHAITELAGTSGSSTADTAAATLSFTDVDLKDTHTASFAAPTIAWSASGSLPSGLSTALASALSLTTSDANGTVTANFSAADSKFDFLAKNETLTITYNVTVSDNHGGTSTKPVVFVVTGTNDAPVVSGTISASLNTNSSAASLNALQNASDVDTHDTLSVVNLPGTLPDGVTYNATTHTFTMDPANATYQTLGQGQSTVVTVNYGVSDGTTTAADSVSWTITGVNHPPTALSITNSTVAENLPGIAIGTLVGVDPDSGSVLTYAINSGLDGSLFAIVGNVLSVGSNGLNAAQTPNPQVSVRVTDQYGAYKDITLGLHVQAETQVALTNGTDNVTGIAANTQVYGAYTALNAADQLQGAGDTALVLYGAGSADLNAISKFQGFSQVDLINYGSGTSAVTLKAGQNLDVKTSGTGSIIVNTSTGHATIESTSNASTTLVGSSGQVDASVAAANLTVTGAGGAMTIVNNAAYGNNTITGGVGNLSYIQASGTTYSEQITGGSGTLTVDLSHATTYQESITAGTGAVNYKSGNGYYNANFYVNSDADWHNGNVVDFTADNNNNSNFQFNGSGGNTIDLTQASIIHAYQLNLNNDTFLINSATVANTQYVYSNTTIETAAASLDLSSLQGSNTLFGSTNATGTTFTVTNKAIGFDVVGGAGQDTLVASGFAYSSDERNAIFATTSVETIKDTSGTYTAIADPNVTKLTAATDTLNLTSAGQTVNGTSITLNNADSLTGQGDTKLAIYGAGTFDLNNLAHYSGFSEVDLNDYFSNAIALTLKSGQDTAVKVNGTASTTVTTSTGHATIQDSSQGSLTLVGSSGQVDATLDTSSLSLTGGAGTMTVADHSNGYNSINVTAGTGALNFTQTGLSYQDTFNGGSGGAMSIDNSGATTYQETVNAGSGLINYKSGTAYYGANFTVNGNGNWQAGDTVDFTASTSNNSSFNFYGSGNYGSGGTTIDLTTATLKNVYGFQLYYDTFVVNSATLAHANYVYGDRAILTADTTLNLSSLTASNVTFASTNATGTTFTVANASIGFDVVGGAGHDTLVASNFAYNASQRAEIFATTSVETIQDTSGTYTAPNDPTVTALTAANDTVSIATAGMSVSGTSTTLTNGDSLTGHGDTKLIVYGGDTLNLNNLAHFSGFSEVDVVNYTSNATSLTLKTGQAMAVNAAGAQNLTVTTADAHATLTTSGIGNTILTGASGQVDATMDTTSLTLNVGTGTMNVTDHGNGYSSINVNGSTGTLNFIHTGVSYQESFAGSSGTMAIDNSGATTYQENFTAGSGLMTYKSGTGYYSAAFTVNGDANWHAGDSVDFTADTSNNGTFTFNGTGGGSTVDLTTASIVHAAQLNLYNDTFLISSTTVASVSSINANTTLETAASSLNLTAVNSASAQFGSTNATGTTFTVANTSVAFDVLGGTGTDTLVGQGFSFSSDQRAQIFTTTSVEIVQDSSGIYANNTGQSLTARTTGDKLLGGAGNDTLISGVGNDTLTGGAGSDTFVFSSVHTGIDAITDFTGGVDALQFNHAIFADAATAFSHAAQSGSDVVITIDGSDSVTLKGYLLSNLHTSDFHIV